MVQNRHKLSFLRGGLTFFFPYLGGVLTGAASSLKGGSCLFMSMPKAANLKYPPSLLGVFDVWMDGGWVVESSQDKANSASNEKIKSNIKDLSVNQPIVNQKDLPKKCVAYVNRQVCTKVEVASGNKANSISN